MRMGFAATGDQTLDQVQIQPAHHIQMASGDEVEGAVAEVDTAVGIGAGQIAAAAQRLQKITPAAATTRRPASCATSCRVWPSRGRGTQSS